MNFFDVIIPEKIHKRNIIEFIETAKWFGYGKICFIFPAKAIKKKDKIESILNESANTTVKTYFGFYARKMKELLKLIKLRRNFDLLIVEGGDLNLNRKACETSEVDILLNPEFNRKDSGMNHIFAKLAAKNNVCLGISLKKFLSTFEYKEVISNIALNIFLAKKYGMKITLVSGASKIEEMVDPLSLVSLGKILGMELKEAKESASRVLTNIIEENLKRKRPEWIAPGIEVVKK